MTDPSSASNRACDGSSLGIGGSNPYSFLTPHDHWRACACSRELRPPPGNSRGWGAGILFAEGGRRVVGREIG